VVSSFWSRRAYAELSTEAGDLARRGLVFLMARKFDAAHAGSVASNLETNGVPVEFRFYELTNTGEPIYAELIESASAVTTFGSAIPARNLNRNFTDTHTAELKSASAVSGGTVIASELFGSQKASGGAGSNKIHTLSASTDYTMVFANLGNQTSTCHINLGFAEGDPAPFPLIQNDGT